jgi:hypothetical protein
MDELTQPQVVQAANQPDSAATSGEGAQEGASGTSGQAQGGAAGQPFLTVRYNKQARPLSRQEAATYAQKGMNYDKLAGRLKAAEAQLKAVEGGKSPSQLTPTAPFRQGGLGELERTKSESSVQATVNAQLGEFVAAHPDVDPAKLPGSVISAWKHGVPLSEAYGAYQARTEQRQERAQAANTANAAASMGGAGSMGAATPQPITDEAIQAMSPAELDRNHGRIWAYLTGKKA